MYFAKVDRKNKKGEILHTAYLLRESYREGEHIKLPRVFPNVKVNVGTRKELKRMS